MVRATYEQKRPRLRRVGQRLLLSVALICSAAGASPLDVALDPVPQAYSNTCQSYSMALAMSFDPASPIRADTVTELRDLEQDLRSKVVQNARSHGRAEPDRSDWKVAVEKTSNGALTVHWTYFANLDEMMRAVADKTGISAAAATGLALSVALVKTPLLLSFKRIGASTYSTSHIATVFGVDLPHSSMTDAAHPRLLLVNSAIKYKNGIKNICADEDLSDEDRYRAGAALTGDYDLNRFSGGKPFLLTWVAHP